MIKKISPEQVAAEKAAIIAATRPTGRPSTVDAIRAVIWQYRDLAPELSLSQFQRFLIGKTAPDGTPLRNYSVSSLSRLLSDYPSNKLT